MHQLPAWFHRISVGLMFYAELVAPICVFGPRVLRRVGFTSLVLLQLLILATGNYGFFNLLAIVLCLSVLDDRDFRAIAALVRFGRGTNVEAAQSTRAIPVRTWTFPHRVVVGILGSLLVVVTTARMIEEALPEALLPPPVNGLVEAVRPFHSANSYGLFRVMTKTRKEITIEGSDDGETWKPYRFRWKPGELDRRPRFATPHMPRLDWQMWFAALGQDCLGEHWFLAFEERLFEGSPSVLALLRENPFTDRPPRILRARLARYNFSASGLERLVDQPRPGSILSTDRLAPAWAGSSGLGLSQDLGWPIPGGCALVRGLSTRGVSRVASAHVHFRAGVDGEGIAGRLLAASARALNSGRLRRGSRS